MIEVTHELTLNVKTFGQGGFASAALSLPGKQSDRGARRLIAHIQNGGEPLAMDGTEEIFLNAKRTNLDTRQRENKSFAASATADGAELVLPAWVFAFPGRVFCEFAVQNAGSVLRTETFVLNVFDAVRTVLDEDGEDLPPDAAPYEGDYEITPGDEAQTLETKNRFLTENLVIAPVPSNYGKISFNGAVLTVS